MATINRVPQGLLSLLDAKTGGNTPPDTANNLQPVLEQLQFYLASIPMQAGQATGNTGGLDSITVASVEIPSGELWAVYGVSVQSLTVAGSGVVGITPTVFTADLDGLPNVICHLQTQATTNTGLGQSISNGVSYAQPVFYGAGTIFRAFCGITSPTETFITTNVLHRRLAV